MSITSAWLGRRQTRQLGSVVLVGMLAGCRYGYDILPRGIQGDVGSSGGAGSSLGSGGALALAGGSGGAPGITGGAAVGGSSPHETGSGGIGGLGGTQAGGAGGMGGSQTSGMGGASSNGGASATGGTSANGASNFAYRMAITIKKANVGLTGGALATTIGDYAMPFKIVNPNLKTVANGGRVQNANGYDIVFQAQDITTCGGVLSTCTLDQEVVSYDATTGTLIAWVRLPSVNTNSAATDTVIYVYYDSSSITTSTGRKTAVWQSDYGGVWHMDESGPPATVYDSTSNARNGTTAGSPASNASGVVNRKLDFNGTSNNASTADFMSGTPSFTVEAWVTQNGGIGNQIIVGKSDTNNNSGTGSNSYVFSLGTDLAAGGSITTVVNTNTSGGANNGNGALMACAVSIGPTSTHHIGVHYATNWGVTTFFDGVEQSSCTYAKNGTLRTTTTPVTIGSLTSPGTGFFKGSIDEVRIDAVNDRDADYFKTVYNHQLDPTSTSNWTIAAEEAIR